MLIPDALRGCASISANRRRLRELERQPAEPALANGRHNASTANIDGEEQWAMALQHFAHSRLRPCHRETVEAPRVSRCGGACRFSVLFGSSSASSLTEVGAVWHFGGPIEVIDRGLKTKRRAC